MLKSVLKWSTDTKRQFNLPPLCLITILPEAFLPLLLIKLHVKKLILFFVNLKFNKRLALRTGVKGRFFNKKI